MRIVIAAPPKTGNSWLKCLYSEIYRLTWLRGDQTPATISPSEFREWLEAGGFPDDSVFHHHYDYSPEFCDTADAHGVTITTILRNPYDQFVSLYHFVQAQADNEERQAKGRPADVMVGKPIDHPDALAYLADGFGRDLVKGIEWLGSGRTVVVRYEALHDDPLAELRRATGQIAPVDDERLRAAIEACQAANLLQSRKGLKKRIRSATANDWPNHLTAAHLRIFQEQLADEVRALGYRVEDPATALLAGGPRA